MAKTDPKVMEAIERFSAIVGDLDPRVRDLMEQVRQGREANDVMADLIRLTMAEPELARKITEAAESEFQPLREESDVEVKESIAALKTLEDRQQALKDLNFDEEDLLFHPEGTEFPQLHPMVMAHIIERLQFDDDIPELRTGDLPVGMMPAVPVTNAARNPVALGTQLEGAAQEVRNELDEVQKEKAEKLNAIGGYISDAESEPGENEATALMVRKAKSEFVAVSEGRVGVEGYRAGHKAAMRKIEPPSGEALVRMAEELRQKYAYKALTSTQGRRSASPVIAALIQSELVARGYMVTLNGREAMMEQPTAVGEWTTQIEGGAADTQSRFAFIDTASKVLALTLARDLEPGVHVLLHVEPINRISERQVGWAAMAVVCQ